MYQFQFPHSAVPLFVAGLLLLTFFSSDFVSHCSSPVRFPYSHQLNLLIYHKAWISFSISWTSTIIILVYVILVCRGNTGLHVSGSHVCSFTSLWKWEDSLWSLAPSEGEGNWVPHVSRGSSEPQRGQVHSPVSSPWLRMAVLVKKDHLQCLFCKTGSDVFMPLRVWPHLGSRASRSEGISAPLTAGGWGRASPVFTNSGIPSGCFWNGLH